MFRFEDAVEIEATPAEVFAFVSDLERIAEWQAGVVRSHVITPGPTRVGTRFEETAKVGPWRLETRCEVVAFDPPRAMRFTASSKPLDYAGTLTVVPDGTHTRLLVEGTMRLKGGWRLMEPVLAGDMKRELRGELKTIKRIVEASPRTATSRP